MERVRTEKLFDLSHTVAAELFSAVRYPWEVLDGIGDFIRRVGPSLEEKGFGKRGEGIWIADDATVAPTAHIGAPCIIGHGTEVRHCAFLRGNVIVGDGAVIGNSTELKNAVLFDGAQAPHYNYVGDSVLGYKSHLGAGAITSNVKGDKSLVSVHIGELTVETGRKKIGAMVGDRAEVGCGSVLNPGTVLGRDCQIYPLTSVRGFVPEKTILKAVGALCEKISIEPGGSSV